LISQLSKDYPELGLITHDGTNAFLIIGAQLLLFFGTTLTMHKFETLEYSPRFLLSFTIQNTKYKQTNKLTKTLNQH